LFFVTKSRRGVLTGEMISYLAEVFRKVCEDFGAVLAECNGQDDHVYLLIEYPPKVAVAALVNSLKGRVRETAPPAVPGPHPPRAPVVTVLLRRVVRRGDASIIRAYVERQRRPD
jgi:putative transposase